MMGTQDRGEPGRGRGWALMALITLASAGLLAACGDAVDNQLLVNAVHNHIATEVTVSGTVTALLDDSTGADGIHQRFDVSVSGVAVEIDHNTTLAPRVPVHDGDTVTIHGQFEPDPGHPVIHYTHHQTGRHEGGYIVLGGQTYQ